MFPVCDGGWINLVINWHEKRGGGVI